MKLLVAVPLAGVLLAAGIVPAALAAPATAVRSTKTAISPVSTSAGKATTITATVSPAPSGGTVSFANGSHTVCSAAAVKAGRATCSMTFTQGSKTLTARYSGKSGSYRASSGSRTITVAATQFVGSLGSCTTSSGALVAVNFGHWGGPVIRECGSPTPSTGLALLTDGGFTTAGDQHDGPQFICRLGHPLFKNGTQYPTPSEDPCIVTPPASAYWSYWLAAKGKNTWTYCTNSAYAEKPKNGEVEAWSFGSSDVSGAAGQPPFAPNQVRAGLPDKSVADRGRSGRRVAAAATGLPAASTSAAGRSSGMVPAVNSAATTSGAGPNLDKAADYLVTQLVGGRYYDPYGVGYADFGLTMDGALALAAVGDHDAALTKVVDFLDQPGEDAAGRTINDYTGIGTKYAAGGAIGKEALVAEATGHDPRDFAGHNLIAALDKLECTKAVTGVCAAPGNYKYSPSTFAQVLPIMAQLRAGDASGAAKPIAYLESLQHSSGAFPSALPGNDSETDSTGMAAMTLALVPGTKARNDVVRALAWLAGKQEKNGGFPGASGESANSAAIVLQALHLDAMTYATTITNGEKFLRAEQDTDGGFDVAAGTSGSDVRASTQALGGAVGTPFGSLLDSLPAKNAASDGADYLVSQLVDGDHYEDTYDGSSYPDQGLTADGMFGLLAAGGHASSVTKMTSYLAGQVEAYADPKGTDGGPYSGALAKLAIVAEATGNNPHSFGGTNLLKALVAKECTKATGGTYPTCTAKGDFFNAFSTVSQALGVLALQASPSSADHLTATSAPVVRLHQLQCKNGGFSSALSKPGAPCSSEVDTTGLAVQALAAVPGTETWLAAARSYLQKAQKSGGLYSGAAGLNTNSTALAAGALQTLIRSQTSTTAVPTTPQTITPISTWQSALTGLDSLAVSGGGWRVSTTTTGADLRSSTQGVQAAAQRSLLQLSGAAIRSLPSTGTSIATGDGSGGGSGSNPGSVRGGSATSSSGGSVPLAATGVDTAWQVAWALALLALGAAAQAGGRRRPQSPVTSGGSVGRHRATQR